MWGRDPRSLMIVAAALDLVGQLFLLLLLVGFSSWLALPLPPEGQGLVLPMGWTLFCLFLYPSLGWLFGSFTLLRWRRLPLLVLLQRVLLTAVGALLVIAVTRWITNPVDSVWLLHRRAQVFWFGGVSIWTLLVRIGLRHGLVLPDAPQLLLLADNCEAAMIQRAWNRVPHHQHLQRIDAEQMTLRLQANSDCFLLTVGPSWLERSRQHPSFQGLKGFDPRRVQVVQPAGLFERQQERLPPVLLADGWMVYDEMPWASPFSFQTQLKRSADVVVAASLLLITSPVLLAAMVLIWLDDPGPVFFRQQRSGWMGDLFIVLKLRTMRVQPADAVASWTQLSDQRITRLGKVLRRLRIDELPQLINVLRGDMSLIGPRPERPEMEVELDRNIPHYRMRHWMRPGLSGWAQVSAPYASSIEDSDLKLSYDLYYIKHFSIFFDLLIFIRTIKTILKAEGR